MIEDQGYRGTLLYRRWKLSWYFKKSQRQFSMLIGISVFIDTRSLGDCSPMITNDSSAHKMEAIFQEASHQGGISRAPRGKASPIPLFLWPQDLAE